MLRAGCTLTADKLVGVETRGVTEDHLRRASSPFLQFTFAFIETGVGWLS